MNKHSLTRKLIQFAAFGFSNIHIGNLATGKLYEGAWKQFCNPGLNCYSCPAASLSCPIGAMQAVSGSPNFNFSFYVVGFLFAVGVVLGRWICGYVCPFGLLQELINKIPSPKLKLPKPVRLFKYFVLIIFVLALPVFNTNIAGMGSPAFCEYICPAGTLEGGLPLIIAHSNLQNTVGDMFVLKLIILILTIAGSIFIYRFFCKTLCPLGAIYGMLNKISLYHVEVDMDRCISCGRCAKACKMDIDPRAFPDSAECIRCGRCRSVCPSSAISLRFGKKRISHINTEISE